MVMKKPNGQMHFIAGSMGSYGEIGRITKCHHDQTGASFGIWEVVNEITYSTDADGDVHFTGKSGVDMTMKAGMAVFK